MDGAAPGPRGSAAVGQGLTDEGWAARRRLYLDNLKVLLVAAIIAAHGIAGYAEGELWPYSEIRETTLTDGATFAVFVLVLSPPLMYPIHPPGETPPSFWYDVTDSGGWGLDAGVMWFVGVLLIFSLCYAAWTRWRGQGPGRLARRQVSLGGLLVLALAVTITTFWVRVVYEYDGDEYLIDLNVYQWPQCLAMFGLGVVASREGWLTAVPDQLRRRCRTATLVSGAAFGAYMAYGASSGAFTGEDAWRGGLNLHAFLFTILESTVTVVGPVWLLAVAQRHLDRPLRSVSPAVRRSAYGAFILQAYVLIGLALAMRPVPLVAEVKALAVAAGSVAGSFALAWLLVRRVPGMDHIL